MNNSFGDSKTSRQINQNLLYFSIPRRFDEIQIDLFNEADISEEYLTWLNDQKHMQFSDQRFKRHTQNSSLEYIKSFEGTPNLFLKVSSTSGVMVGTLTAYIDVEELTHTCGILIGPRFSRAGYGKRAWFAMTHQICPALGARKIVAGTLESNLAMVKLFEFSDMNFDARVRGENFYNGHQVDVLMYSRLLSAI